MNSSGRDRIISFGSTIYHSATQVTPFEAVYGRPPPNLLSYVKGTAKVQAVEDTLISRDKLLASLKKNLQLARDRTKRNYDKKHVEHEFAVGDMVYLRLQPYKQSSVATRSLQKLFPKYFGPFQVLDSIGKLAYRLQLPKGSKIHPIFHVSLLKKHLGTTIITDSALPAWAPLLPEEPQVILNRRISGKNADVLVQWKERPKDEAIWEMEADFKERYPNFPILLDKDFFG